MTTELTNAAQQALEVLKTYRDAYNEAWVPGMEILEPEGDQAIDGLESALTQRPAVEPMTPEQREVLAALVVGACEHKTRTLLAIRAIEATEGQYGIGITAKAEGGA